MRKVMMVFTVALAACSTVPDTPQTVTIIKTVPVVPPENLYAVGGGCSHGPARDSGTVNDLANAFIAERAAIDVCLGDRAALRQWSVDVKKGAN